MRYWTTSTLTGCTVGEQSTTLTDLVQATPPVGINLMLLGGIPLAQWVIILNFSYIAILLLYKLYRIWKEHRGR